MRVGDPVYLAGGVRCAPDPSGRAHLFPPASASVGRQDRREVLRDPRAFTDAKAWRAQAQTDIKKGTIHGPDDDDRQATPT